MWVALWTHLGWTPLYFQWPSAVTICARALTRRQCHRTVPCQCDCYLGWSSEQRPLRDARTPRTTSCSCRKSNWHSAFLKDVVAWNSFWVDSDCTLSWTWQALAATGPSRGWTGTWRFLVVWRLQEDRSQCKACEVHYGRLSHLLATFACFEGNTADTSTYRRTSGTDSASCANSSYGTGS